MDNALKMKSYEWIYNSIKSSNNPFHVECCKKLIELFVIKFNDSNLESELIAELSMKETSINYL